MKSSPSSIIKRLLHPEKRVKTVTTQDALKHAIMEHTKLAKQLAQAKQRLNPNQSSHP